MKMTGNNPLLRLFFVCGAFLLSLTLLTAWAQAQAGPDNVDIRDTVAALQLTNEQETAFVAIMTDYREAMRATMEKHGVDPAAGRPPLRVMMSMRNDVRRNTAQMEEQMAALLTPAQMKTFRHIQDTRRRELRNGR